MPRDSRASPARGTVTLADVARTAGVSLATASFVLSGRGGSRSAGSETTKAKVRAAAAELGYVPNRHAQAMRTGRGGGDRKSTRLNSSHGAKSRMPSSA